MDKSGKQPSLPLFYSLHNLWRYTHGPVFALLFCLSARFLKSDGRQRAEAQRGLENKVGWREGASKCRAGRRLNVSAAIKVIANTVIDTRLSFTANIVGAARRNFLFHLVRK